MLQTLKITGDEKNIFVSSDLHIGQSCMSWSNPLWATRGYSSKEAHKEGVIEKWNSVCNENSVCCLLGDHIFEDERGEGFRSLFNSLRYKRLYCFLGNHNSGHGIVYKQILAENFPSVFAIGAEVYPLEWNLRPDKTVVFLPQYAEIVINKDFYALSHYPIASHNKQGKGSYGLFGHSHNNLPLTNKDKGSGRRLDMGWDAWGRPVSIYEIKKYLTPRSFDCQDHH